MIAVMSKIATPRNITVNGNAYSFIVKHGISLAWVDDKDLQAILKLKGGCCNHQNNLFGMASEMAVKVWNEGHY